MPVQQLEYIALEDKSFASKQVRITTKCVDRIF